MWNLNFLEQIRTDGYVSRGKVVCRPVGWAISVPVPWSRR